MTEAQPNPPLHQGNRQPPHKTVSNTTLQNLRKPTILRLSRQNIKISNFTIAEKRGTPHKQKQKHTEVLVDKKPPTPLQRRAQNTEEQWTQVVLHTPHT